MYRLLTRYTALYAVLLGALVFLLLSLYQSQWWLILAIPFVILSVMGFVDLRQTRHAIRRNYPVIGEFTILV